MKYSLVCEGEIKYSSHKKISNSASLALFFRENWPSDLFRESVAVLALDRENKPIGYSVLFKGGVSASIVDPKVVFGFLLQLPTCASFALAHNHPSGSSRPSNTDGLITEKLKKAGSLMDLPMIDHIILGNSEYFSFADNGLI